MKYFIHWTNRLTNETGVIKSDAQDGGYVLRAVADSVCNQMNFMFPGILHEVKEG